MLTPYTLKASVVLNQRRLRGPQQYAAGISGMKLIFDQGSVNETLQLCNPTHSMGRFELP